MRYMAHIRPGSIIDRNWRSLGRLGGTVAGVQFNKVGDRFVSEEIDTPHISALIDMPSVQLETMGVMPSDGVLDGDMTPVTKLPGRGRPRKVANG